MLCKARAIFLPRVCVQKKWPSITAPTPTPSNTPSNRIEGRGEEDEKLFTVVMTRQFSSRLCLSFQTRIFFTIDYIPRVCYSKDTKTFLVNRRQHLLYTMYIRPNGIHSIRNGTCHILQGQRKEI